MAIIGSVIAAYKFGSMIANNLLQTLPTSVPFYVMLILMSLQLCFSVTVASSAMFMQIENYFNLPESECFFEGIIFNLHNNLNHLQHFLSNEC